MEMFRKKSFIRRVMMEANYFKLKWHIWIGDNPLIFVKKIQRKL